MTYSFLRSIGAFVLLGALTSNLFANTIQVNDVKVDVTAKSSLSARDQAIVKARQFAFQKLGRENPEFAISSAAPLPSDDVLENMVDDYEIVREKLSNVRYIGTFNISFNKRSLTKYLAGPDKYRAVSYSKANDEPVSLLDATTGVGGGKQSPTKIHSGKLSYVLIPVYISADDSLLWEDNNSWHHYWVREETKTQGKEYGIEYTVPLADLRDIQSLTIEDAMTVKIQPISKLLERYQKEAAILVMLKKIDDTGNTHELVIKDFTRAGPNRSVEPITLEAHNQKMPAVFATAKKKAFDFMQGHLTDADNPIVNVAGGGDSQQDDEVSSDRTTPQDSDQINQNDEGQDEQAEQEADDAYHPAPSDVRPLGESKGGIGVTLAYNSLREWQDIRRKISSQNWIKSFDVVSFNKDQARVMIDSNFEFDEVNRRLSAIGVKTTDAVDKANNSNSHLGSQDGGLQNTSAPKRMAPLSIRNSAPKYD